MDITVSFFHWLHGLLSWLGKSCPIVEIADFIVALFNCEIRIIWKIAVKLASVVVGGSRGTVISLNFFETLHY